MLQIFIRYTSVTAVLLVTALGLTLGSARGDEGTVQKNSIQFRWLLPLEDSRGAAKHLLQ